MAFVSTDVGVVSGSEALSEAWSAESSESTPLSEVVSGSPEVVSASPGSAGVYTTASSPIPIKRSRELWWTLSPSTGELGSYDLEGSTPWSGEHLGR